MCVKNKYKRGEKYYYVRVKFYFKNKKVLETLSVEVPINIIGHFAQYPFIRNAVLKSIPYNHYTKFSWEK